jgi:hypothetical protein
MGKDREEQQDADFFHGIKKWQGKNFTYEK